MAGSGKNGSYDFPSPQILLSLNQDSATEEIDTDESNHQSGELHSDCSTESVKTFDKLRTGMSVSNDEEPIGFKTASGRVIRVSDKALDDAKKRFEEPDGDEMQIDLTAYIPLLKPDSRPDAGQISNKHSDAVKSDSVTSTLGDSGKETAKFEFGPSASTTSADKDEDFGHFSGANTKRSDMGSAIASVEIEDLTNSLLLDSSGHSSNWDSVSGNSLAAIKSGDETVSVLKAVVARTYPVLYCVSLQGSAQFLSEKSYLAKKKTLDNKKKELCASTMPEIEQKIRDGFEKDMSTGNVGVEEKINRQLPQPVRNCESTPVLKVRVVDHEVLQSEQPSRCGIISMWNPDVKLVESVKENKMFEFHSLHVDSLSASEILFSSTAGSRIQSVDTPTAGISCARKLITIREALSSDFSPLFGEFDTVGLVTEVTSYSANSGQSVIISDPWKNRLKIKFWNSIDDAGLGSLLKVGVIIACQNLQWRRCSSKLRIAFAQEMSTFETDPKAEHLVKGYQNLCLAITGKKYYSSPGSPRSRVSRPMKRRQNNDSTTGQQDTCSPIIVKQGKFMKSFVPPRKL